MSFGWIMDAMLLLFSLQMLKKSSIIGFQFMDSVWVCRIFSLIRKCLRQWQWSYWILKKWCLNYSPRHRKKKWIISQAKVCWPPLSIMSTWNLTIFSMNLAKLLKQKWMITTIFIIWCALDQKDLTWILLKLWCVWDSKM